MQDTRPLDRREFTAEAVLAMLSGVVILVDSTTTNGHEHTVTFNPSTSPGTGY